MLLERLFADPGSFGVVGCRNINDVGGALSFCARNDEVLFVLGAREGRLVSEGTLIVSRLLWPGTPSKMAAVFGLVPLVVGGGVFLGASGSGIPSLNEAALVMRGLIAGAFVEATWIVSVRLWPGTLAKVFASCSLDTGTRCLFSEGAGTTPARKAAALVVRGTMSGDAWDAGRPRALNWGFFPDLLPIVDGGDLRLSLVGLAITPPSTGGRSEIGNGGEEANKEAICASAAWASGDPMIPFCAAERP